MNNSGGVYQHVVLFKFHAHTGPEDEAKIIDAFRALCKELDFVRGFEWGRNSSPEPLSDGFTHCFIVTFADAAGRDMYLPHPAHLAFCNSYLDPHVEKVCVVDFLSNL